MGARGSPASAGRLSRTWQSSQVIGLLRRIGRGSLVCLVIVRLGRSLSSRSSWIAKQFASRPPSRTFPHATRMAATSTVLTAVEHFFVRTARAWRQSAVKVALIDRVIAPLEAWQRVRLIGWVIVVAAITHAMLGFATLFPSWRGLVMWVFVLVIGISLIVACRPIAVAWRSWRRPPGPSGR